VWVGGLGWGVMLLKYAGSSSYACTCDVANNFCQASDCSTVAQACADSGGACTYTDGGSLADGGAVQTSSGVCSCDELDNMRHPPHGTRRAEKATEQANAKSWWEALRFWR
jgi:hypothetical protein